MSELGYHLMLRLRDDRVLAPSPRDLCLLARVVLKVGRHYRLLAFGTADSHLHIEMIGDRRQAGQFARRVELALGRRIGPRTGFNPAHLKKIEDQHHLENVFDYTCAQQKRHALTNDPYRDGTILPDLLGLRVLGSFAVAHVRAYLPRLRRQRLLELFGRIDLGRAYDSLERLSEAAAAAIGRVKLRGRSADVRSARRAAVHLASGRWTTTEIARHLGVSTRTVSSLRRAHPDSSLLHAIELQLRLRRDSPKCLQSGVRPSECSSWPTRSRRSFPP